MTLPNDAPPKGTTYFCEDVRTELGGKFSFMGLLQDFLGIFEPEVRLPKLVAFTVLDFPSRYAGKSADLGIWNGDSKIGGGTADVPQPAAFADPRIPIRCRMNVPFELIGLLVKDGMQFEVRAKVEDFDYVSPRLEVLHLPSVRNFADVPNPSLRPQAS